MFDLQTQDCRLAVAATLMAAIIEREGVPVSHCYLVDKAVQLADALLMRIKTTPTSPEVIDLSRSPTS